MQTRQFGFDASELCSRKLWQLLNAKEQLLSSQQRQQALRELCARDYSAARQQMANKSRHR